MYSFEIINFVKYRLATRLYLFPLMKQNFYYNP